MGTNSISAKSSPYGRENKIPGAIVNFVGIDQKQYPPVKYINSWRLI